MVVIQTNVVHQLIKLVLKILLRTSLSKIKEGHSLDNVSIHFKLL
jgi:hypothetical protein